MVDGGWWMVYDQQLRNDKAFLARDRNFCFLSLLVYVVNFPTDIFMFEYFLVFCLHIKMLFDNLSSLGRQEKIVGKL